MDTFDDDPDIVPVIWDFNPYIPTRTDRIQEVLYLKIWQDMMLPDCTDGTYKTLSNAYVAVDPYFVDNEPYNYPILSVFGDRGRPTAHDTRIVSNMTQWLGTNLGQYFLHKAAQLWNDYNEPELAYVFAWAGVNIRNPGNPRFREHLITDFNPAAEGSARTQTLRDVETLELFVRWLGTETGLEYLSQCRQAIDAEYKKSRGQNPITSKFTPQN